jgi:cytochrome d ubiquinol oxidase subunit I
MRATVTNLRLGVEEILAMTAGPAELLPAPALMAFTLGSHVILLPLGAAFPFLVLIANFIGLKMKDPTALLLAQRWSQVMAVLFAVGAVSGTVLSFEMGLLWPWLIGIYGDVFGMPISMEGIFFFVEAIFVLRRNTPRVSWGRSPWRAASGAGVWRNTPTYCRNR